MARFDHCCFRISDLLRISSFGLRICFRFGPVGFYMSTGKPVFVYNYVNLERFRWEGKEALAPGRHTLEFDFKYYGLGIGTLAFNNMSCLGRPGTGTLKVDGKAVQPITMPHTLAMIL